MGEEDCCVHEACPNGVMSLPFLVLESLELMY